MFYEKVFRSFNEKGIRYIVVGGIALNLHGVPRATADLDLMVVLDNKNLKKIAVVLSEMGFRPRLPVKAEEFCDSQNLEKWNKEKKMEAFTFWNPKKYYEEVDILIHNPIDFEALDKAKEIIEARGIKIPIVSLDHLIKLKETCNREQDKSDVEALKKIKQR